MIELKNIEQFKNAIERAQANRQNLLVKMTKMPRQYAVVNKNTGNSYLVCFFVSKNGKRFGQCSCKASEFKKGCVHLICAAALNVALAEQGYFKNLT